MSLREQMQELKRAFTDPAFVLFFTIFFVGGLYSKAAFDPTPQWIQWICIFTVCPIMVLWTKHRIDKLRGDDVWRIRDMEDHIRILKNANEDLGKENVKLLKEKSEKTFTTELNAIDMLEL